LPSSVQLIDLPGRRDCGLLVGGDAYPEWPSVTDSFDEGPSREPPTPRCADTPDDGEIWALDPEGVHRVDAVTPGRSTGIALRQVRDVQAGKPYLFDTGQTGALCNLFHGLPSAFEWRAGSKGPKLVPSVDGYLLDRLLRRQCVQEDKDVDVFCEGIDQKADESTPS